MIKEAAHLSPVKEKEEFLSGVEMISVLGRRGMEMLRSRFS